MIKMMLFLFIAVIGLWTFPMSGSQTTISSQERVKCPTFWTSFENNCYRLISQPASWRNAEAKCHELGTDIDGYPHLVSIHSQEENDFILQYLESTFVDQVYFNALVEQGILIIKDKRPHNYNALWIGSTFSRWSDKTRVKFSLWLNPNSTDICGHMWTSSRIPEIQGKWDKTDCSIELPYICKFKRRLEGIVPALHVFNIEFKNSCKRECFSYGC